jgi:hypothetical protein
VTNADKEAARAREALRRGLADPDAFFWDRGIALTFRETDNGWAVDLGTRLRSYGSGETLFDAKLSAVPRWMVEQEGPDLRRLPGESLP